jgi:Orsellinic acid/F9775 biosynthesis cluster protein D
MVFSDNEDTHSDGFLDDQETQSENTNARIENDNAVDSEETESNNSGSTTEEMINGLPDDFDNVLQTPIVLNQHHQQLSNIFVISRRFGCIICIYNGCGKVVGATKCYDHLRDQHNDVLVQLQNGGKKALRNSITSAKQQNTPVFEIPEDIYQQQHIPEPYLPEIDGFKCTRCASLNCFFAGLHARTVSQHVLHQHVRTGQLLENNNSDIVQCNAQSIAKGVAFQLVDNGIHNNNFNNNINDDSSADGSMFNESFYNTYGDYVADGIPWMESNAATRMNLVEHILHMKGIITTDEYKVVDWILMGEKNPCSPRLMCKKIRQVAKDFLTKAKSKSKGADSDWLRLIAIDSSQRAQFYPTQTDCPPVYVKVISELLIWLAFIQKEVCKPVFIDPDIEEAGEPAIPDDSVEVDSQLYVDLYEAIPARWTLAFDDNMTALFKALFATIKQSILADNDAITLAQQNATEYISPPLNVFGEMHSFLEHIFARSSFIKTQNDPPNGFDFLATFIAATTLKPDGHFKASDATGCIAGLEYVLRLCVINEAVDMHQQHFEENADTDAQRLISNATCVNYIMKWTRYHEPSGENFRNHTVLLLLSHLKARIVRFSPESTVATVQFVDPILKTDLRLVNSGQVVSLSRLRQMISSAFASAED